MIRLASKLYHGCTRRRLIQPRNLPPTHRVERSASNHNTDDRRIIASIDGGVKSGPAEPLPQDAKAQATSAFRQIGLVIRAILYGSLGLGLTATVGFFGIHLWVEYLELRPGQVDNGRMKDDRYGWDEEIEGWGAGYLGKGTQPGLGWRTRALIRAAWVAENWQAGRAALGFPDSHEVPDGRLVDSAYAMSESRLQQAIFMMKESSSKLADSSSWDRTLLELQLRLASICERINTPLSLIKCFEIHSQIWRSCLRSNHDPNSKTTDTTPAWKTHQAIRSAGHLAQIGLRIAALERQVDPSRADHFQQMAEGYLTWAIGRSLGLKSISIQDPSGVPISDPKSDELKIESSDSSSWRNLLGRASNSNRKSSAMTLPLSLAMDLKSIEEELGQFLGSSSSINHSDPYLTWSPILARLTISSLLKLSAHLASIDLNRAFTLQVLTHGLLDSIIKSQESSPIESPDGKLHYYWLKSRAALSSVYLSEIGQATDELTDQEVVDQCRNVLALVGTSLSNLEEEASRSEVFQVGLTRVTSGRLSEPLMNLRRDIRLTATMASNFLGLKYEGCPSKQSMIPASSKLRSQLSWCYSHDPEAEDGCQLAKKFFQLAVDYSLGDSKEHRTGRQDSVLLGPLNENLYHLSRIDSLSKKNMA